MFLKKNKLNQDLKWENNYFKVTGGPRSFKVVQKNNGVVIAPQIKDKFILIKIKRVDQNEHWEFPRGFMEDGENFEHGGLRELKEEVNVNATEIQDLGKINVDSGVILSNVRLMLAKVPESEISKIKLQKSEKIIDYKLFTLDEICELVRNKELDDSFTRSICLNLILDNKFQNK